MIEYLDLWREWLPTLLGGFALSLKVAGLSLLLGIPLGLLLALGVQAKSRPVKLSSLAFVELSRGTPALVLLQFAYYGLPSAGLTLTSYASAVLALACCTGAYTSEIIRGGLESVAAGQKEAADAIGLSQIDALRYIILPQGLMVALPALLGFSITILQSTSLCFAITLPELISRAYSIGSSTFLYLPALILAGVIYAAVCVPATIAVGKLEDRLSHHTR
ncbi:amino acid ABC transporter permease [Mesorhizobium sp.]|uniref:amino acid ABC transporter permease n=1 Tax=Mesorhizobium sp. TaxID=1871066 RepID=UPI0025D9A95F|nr:amino acid ABC transporter permease [Mesorhizobium sp.]